MVVLADAAVAAVGVAAAEEPWEAAPGDAIPSVVAFERIGAGGWLAVLPRLAALTDGAIRVERAFTRHEAEARVDAGRPRGAARVRTARRRAALKGHAAIPEAEPARGAVRGRRAGIGGDTGPGREVAERARRAFAIPAAGGIRADPRDAGAARAIGVSPTLADVAAGTEHAFESGIAVEIPRALADPDAGALDAAMLRGALGIERAGGDVDAAAVEAGGPARGTLGIGRALGWRPADACLTDLPSLAGDGGAALRGLAEADVALLIGGAIGVDRADRRGQGHAGAVDARGGGNAGAGRRTLGVGRAAAGHLAEAIDADHLREGAGPVLAAEEGRHAALRQAAPATGAFGAARAERGLAGPEIAALEGPALGVVRADGGRHAAEAVAAIGRRTLGVRRAMQKRSAATEQAEIPDRALGIHAALMGGDAAMGEQIAKLPEATFGVSDAAGRHAASVRAAEPGGALGIDEAFPREDAARVRADRTDAAIGRARALPREDTMAPKTGEASLRAGRRCIAFGGGDADEGDAILGRRALRTIPAIARADARSVEAEIGSVAVQIAEAGAAIEALAALAMLEEAAVEIGAAFGDAELAAALDAGMGQGAFRVGDTLGAPGVRPPAIEATVRAWGAMSLGAAGAEPEAGAQRGQKKSPQGSAEHGSG